MSKQQMLGFGDYEAATVAASEWAKRNARGILGPRPECIDPKWYRLRLNSLEALLAEAVVLGLDVGLGKKDLDGVRIQHPSDTTRRP